MKSFFNLVTFKTQGKYLALFEIPQNNVVLFLTTVHCVCINSQVFQSFISDAKWGKDVVALVLRTCRQCLQLIITGK